MVHRIGQSLHKLRIPSILAVANTPAAAYAMTCAPSRAMARCNASA